LTLPRINVEFTQTSRYTFHTQRFTIYRKFVGRFTPIWLALIVTSYNKTVFSPNHRTTDYMEEAIYSRTYFQSPQKQRKLYYEISLFGSVTSSRREAALNISLQNLLRVHKISLNAKIMIRFGRTFF